MLVRIGRLSAYCSRITNVVNPEIRELVGRLVIANFASYVLNRWRENETLARRVDGCCPACYNPQSVYDPKKDISFGENMDLARLAPYLSIIEIILAIAMIVLVILQSKGSDISAMTGGSSDAGSFRTKRGLEATMHRVTIWTSVVFFIVTILTFIALGQVA